MNKGILAAFIVLLWTFPAYAEVMDKEPSVLMIWGVATACSALGLIAARFKPILVVITGLSAVLYYGGIVAEISDQTTGKAIIKESGNSYPLHAYAAATVVILAHAAGLALRKYQKQKANR